MSTVLVAIIVAALSAYSPLPAQRWSTEEQEIIDLNQSCWDAWAAQDLDAVRRTCNEHPDGRGWYTPEAGPSVGWFEKNADEGRHKVPFCQVRVDEFFGLLGDITTTMIRENVDVENIKRHAIRLCEHCRDAERELPVPVRGKCI